MSYIAQGLMDQIPGVKEYRDQMNRAPDPEEAPVEVAAPAPAPAPTPEAPTPVLTPEQSANIAKERQRFATAGIAEDTASRLLGGPRQKLGA